MIAAIAASVAASVLGLGTVTADPPGGLDRGVSSTVIVTTATGQGAGVHLGGGRILTAAHVVDSGAVAVADAQDAAIGVGQVVRRDPVRDLALIQLPTSQGRQLPSASLRAAPARVGEQVFAAGAPLGDYVQVSSGIVSAVVVQDSVTRVQTDAPVNPGNSGGPLLDESGQVVGIVVTKSASGEGIGWATSADEASGFLARDGDGPSEAVGSESPPVVKAAEIESPRQGLPHVPVGAIAMGLGLMVAVWLGVRPRRSRHAPTLDLSDLSKANSHTTTSTRH